LKAVQGLITKDTVDWKLQNLYVSSEFNYQDGWWTVDANKKWTEVDKPANNTCFGNGQCQPDASGVNKGLAQCCGSYPDSNNRKCMLKSLDGTTVTVGPAKFVPTCATDAGSGTVQHSKDDIAKTALSDASEKVKKFNETKAADDKKAAGYATMDAAAQKAYDAKVAAKDKERDALYAKFKTEAGVDKADCDTNCKLLYEKDLYDWIEKKYKLCKADAKQIGCVKGDALRSDELKARGAAAKNYYAKMTDAERTTFNTGRKDAIAKEEANLVALVKKENAPKAKDDGFSCKDAACTGTNQCCGTSTPTANAAGVTTGQQTKVCAVAADGWSDVFGKKFTHVCDSGATKLFATAAAAVAALSLM